MLTHTTLTRFLWFQVRGAKRIALEFVFDI